MEDGEILVKRFKAEIARRSCRQCQKRITEEMTLVLMKGKAYCRECGLVLRPCRFDRCNIDVKPGDDHEQYCEFRPIRCKVASCEWEGSAREFHAHLKHKERNDNFDLLGWRLHSNKQFDKDKEFYGVRIFHLGEVQLLIEVEYVPRRETTFTFSPIFKPESALWAKVSFSSSKSMATKGILLDTDEEYIAGNHRIVFSSDTVHYYVNLRGVDLKVHVNKPN